MVTNYKRKGTTQKWKEEDLRRAIEFAKTHKKISGLQDESSESLKVLWGIIWKYQTKVWNLPSLLYSH